MYFGSVCAGIEAASVAWEPLGWKASWYAEIEPFPCSVLAHHHPNVPNLGDMTLLENNEQVARSPLDLLVGGTPCQGFSVAGLRKGLADDRSNLALSYVRLALRRRPRWIVWENVPGCFTTSKGEDFGSFLSGLSGVDVSVPEGGWKNSGIIVGAVGHYGLAWRVLDAQYAGVPQRRRRVFVVGYFGDWRRAAAVLFERESLHGNTPPSRQSRKDLAPTLSARTKGGGGLGTDFDLDGGLVASTGDIAHCLNAGGMGRRDYETKTFIAFASEGSPTLRAGGNSTGGDRPPGTDVDTCETLVAFNLRGREGGSMPEPDHLASMRAASGGSSRSYIAFSAKDSGADAGEITPTLRAGGHSASHANAGVMPAVAYAFAENQRAEVTLSDTAPSLKVGGGKPGQGYPAVAYASREIASSLTSNYGKQPDNSDTGLGPNLAIQSMAVRRLTPRECERLQGFPDDYTAVPHRGKPAADGPRYKALGNSFAVPVVRWIGERIQMVEDFINENLER